MPPFLTVLAVVALVLHILFTYIFPPYPWPSSEPAPRPSFSRALIAVVVIVLVLVFWFLIPVHVGPPALR